MLMEYKASRTVRSADSDSIQVVMLIFYFHLFISIYILLYCCLYILSCLFTLCLWRLMFFKCWTFHHVKQTELPCVWNVLFKKSCLALPTVLLVNKKNNFSIFQWTLWVYLSHNCCGLHSKPHWPHLNESISRPDWRTQQAIERTL